jgi:hypothetical protein
LRSIWSVWTNHCRWYDVKRSRYIHNYKYRVSLFQYFSFAKWGSGVNAFSLRVASFYNEPITKYLTNQLTKQQHQFSSHSIISQHFMEPEGWLPRSQELYSHSFPELDKYKPHQTVVTL